MPPEGKLLASDEGIVLFGCAFRQRLEPVGVVGDAVFVGPLLHAVGHGVGNGAVEWGTVVNHVNQFVVYVALKILIHLRASEHVLAEILRRALHGSHHFEGLFGESLFYNLKSEICHIPFMSVVVSILSEFLYSEVTDLTP